MKLKVHMCSLSTSFFLIETNWQIEDGPTGQPLLENAEKTSDGHSLESDSLVNKAL